MTSSKKGVLVVDDEEDIVELIRYNLTKEGFEVRAARNGKEALDRLSPFPDLIILDLMMPVMDGFETCRRIKAQPSTSAIPIVFLTASASEVDEVVGLELGADDYIQKPISPRKLVARVKAVLRRAENSGEGIDLPDITRIGPLEINRSAYAVRIGRKEVPFPRKEFEVLALLAAHPGRVFTREALLAAVWGTEVVVIDRTVDVHIRKIREKLGGDADLIETIKGVGYRFRATETRSRRLPL
jgi:two-component system alkaline phosphatase synthesis response regulator PhoP